MNNNYLEHHGIKGMKWYERRFQNEDGSLTPAGRERYGVGKPREASVAVRMKNGLKRAGSAVVNTTKAKVKAYVDAAPERREKKKQKILQSGDASLILKNKKKFSNQELQEGLNRARSIDAVRQETNAQAFARIEGVVNKFAKIANTGLTAVNTVENIRNGIDKIKSWGEEKDFVGKTPEELLSNAKNLSSTGAKKLADRLNSIVNANKSVNEINTAGIKSELDKYETLEKLRKARETYTNNLNKKDKKSKFDISKMSEEEIRKHVEEFNKEELDEAEARVKKLRTIIGGKKRGNENPNPNIPDNTTSNNTQNNGNQDQEKKSEETASKPKENTRTSSSSQQTSNNTSQPSKPAFTQSNNKSQLIQPSKPPENANNNRSNLFNGSKSEKDQAWENLGKAMEKTYNDNKISNNEKAMDWAKKQAKRDYTMGMDEAEKAANEASEQIEKFLEAEKYYANRLGYKG